MGSLAVAQRPLPDLAAGRPPLVDTLRDDCQVPITALLEYRQPGGGTLAMSTMCGDKTIVRQVLEVNLRERPGLD